jgi:lysophospholipase L1-like esterase
VSARAPSTPASGSRGAALAGRVALLCASTLVALLAGEGVYRLRTATDELPDGDDGGWRDRYRRMNETIYRRSADPELVYEPVPSSAVEMEYGTAGFDAGGMRDDREHPRERVPGRTRVAIVGDSIVWSEFVAVHDSLPRRLEEALGEGFEVLPFGVSGYDTTQEARWYEVAVRPYSPEIVVVVWCMNDLVIMSGPFERFATGEDRARKDAQDAWLEEVAPVRRETIDWVNEQREEQATFRVLARAWGMWERARLERDYVDEYLLAFDDAPRRARAEAALSRLGHAIRDDGARPVLVISPVLERWERYRWHAIHDFVRSAAEAAGFEVLDLLEVLGPDEDPEALRVGSDNLHYGRTGNRVVGEALARALARSSAR